MNTKRMVFIGLFASLLCIICPIAVPIGTIPVTLSLFGIFVASLVLPDFDGVTAVLIYVILGIFGMPVFSGWKGGIAILTSATGGFIISYPLIALIIALFKKRIFSLFISLLVLYFFGAIWLCVTTGISLESAIATAVVPFIAPDLIKLFCALFISKSLKKAGASFYKLG